MQIVKSNVPSIGPSSERNMEVYFSLMNTLTHYTVYYTLTHYTYIHYTVVQYLQVQASEQL